MKSKLIYKDSPSILEYIENKAPTIIQSLAGIIYSDGSLLSTGVIKWAGLRWSYDSHLSVTKIFLKFLKKKTKPHGAQSGTHEVYLKGSFPTCMVTLYTSRYKAFANIYKEIYNTRVGEKSRKNMTSPFLVNNLSAPFLIFALIGDGTRISSQKGVKKGLALNYQVTRAVRLTSRLTLQELNVWIEAFENLAIKEGLPLVPSKMKLGNDKYILSFGFRGGTLEGLRSYLKPYIHLCPIIVSKLYSLNEASSLFNEETLERNRIAIAVRAYDSPLKIYSGWPCPQEDYSAKTFNPNSPYLDIRFDVPRGVHQTIRDIVLHSQINNKISLKITLKLYD